MKICKIEGEYEDWKNSRFFDHEKVHFPASKCTSECFLYPPKLSQCVKRSLEILLDTHNMGFGRLDCILVTIEKISHLRHIGQFYVERSMQN